MADKTMIEWTDTTWNPVTGCTKVSPGCANCYAELVEHRFDHDKVGKLSWALPASQGGRGVTLHPERLQQPNKWRKPRKVFVNSMSDLFHPDVPFEFIGDVFLWMALAPKHTFQVLTKRPERMLEWFKWADDNLHYERKAHYSDISPLPRWDMAHGNWPLRNVWLGVSVENQRMADLRVPLLLHTPAAVRFVSYEPALRPVDFGEWLSDRCGDCYSGNPDIPPHDHELQSTRLDQIIIGGESGPRARPCEWPLEGEIEQALGFGRTPLQGGIEHAARSTVEQCRAAGVAVFVKQMGSVWAIHHAHGWECGEYYTTYAVKETYRPDRKGGDMEHWPEDLRVREYPKVVEAVMV